MSISSLEKKFSSLSVQPKQPSFTNYLLVISEQVQTLMHSLVKLAITKTSAPAYKDLCEIKFQALKKKTHKSGSDLDYLDLAKPTKAKLPQSSVDPLYLELPCIISQEHPIYDSLTSLEKKAKEVQTKTILDRLHDAFRTYVYPTFDVVANAYYGVLDDENVVTLPHRTLFFVKEIFHDCRYSTVFFAKGGFGEIHKLTPPTADKTFAIKIPRKTLAGIDEKVTEALRTEAAALLQIQHPNIIALDAITNIKLLGICYIMPFIDGRPLDKELVRLSYSNADLILHVKQIVSALTYLHEKSIVHKDIKPNNIMITKEGQAVLLDFGLARKIKDCWKCSGSTLYIAPELGHPAAIVIASEKVDVYSFGVTLFEMTTGGAIAYPLKSGEDNKSYFRRVSQDTFKKPCDANKIKEHLNEDQRRCLAMRDPTGELMSIAVACMNGQPAHRPSMQQLQQLLEKF